MLQPLPLQGEVMPHRDEQSLSQFLDLLANDGYRRLIVIGSGEGDEGCVDDIFMSESPTDDDELDPDDVEGVRDTYESIEPLLDLINHTQWQDNQGGNFRIVLTCPEATNEWELDQEASYVQLNESAPKTRPLGKEIFEPEKLPQKFRAYLQAHFLAVRAGTNKPFSQALKFLAWAEGDDSEMTFVGGKGQLTETEQELWTDFIQSTVIDCLDDNDNIHNDEGLEWNLQIYPSATRDGTLNLQLDRVPTITWYVDEPSEKLIPVQNKLEDLLGLYCSQAPVM